MEIEARYFLKNRHNCNWTQYGGEVIGKGVDGTIKLDKVVLLDAFCDKDEIGEYGNILVKGGTRKSPRIKLWESDECKDIEYIDAPILLVPGQVLQICAGVRYVELRLGSGNREIIHSDSAYDGDHLADGVT